MREIGITEELRELAAKEVTEPGANKSAAMIRSGTRIVLELTSQVAILKSMSLNPPFDDVPATIAAFYQQKIDAYNKVWRQNKIGTERTLPDVRLTSAFGGKPEMGGCGAESVHETLSDLDERGLRQTHLLQPRLGTRREVPGACKRQRQPRPGATCLRIASMTWAL